MDARIAVVGMGCRYPDSRSPVELWENVMAQRRAFRRVPPERLSLDDYFSADRRAPDCIYSTEGAYIEGYEFARVRFRVAGDTFRSADLAHWLALGVAAEVFADAGYPDGRGLPRESTGVFIGNTLTGEFSRANLMRLRWPYVRRVLDRALAEEDWGPGRRRSFLSRLEASYKRPFPPVGDETLAGSLSNTIAGRICNHFDLKGGGYTLDGACASSLLALAHACTGLAVGDIDVALAGGVDLSMDPFEFVGFAKAGALAAEEMRVYDVRSAGFWPGEGCGLVALMRYEDAVALRRPVYAAISGWGISSDGSGGLTRPEVEGQLLALRRAYRRAGYDIGTVAYFEGHGTGTGVGDTVELQALTRARRDGAAQATPAAIGSVKANIGHTKAAAGAAGLIKAVMALKAQLLPPTTGCEEPHAELRGATPALRVLRQAEPWPGDQHLRAGVSGMGFGGINAHLTLEAAPAVRRRRFNAKERSLDSSSQDAELFMLGASGVTELLAQVEHLLTFAAGLSRSELTDAAARLEREIRRGEVRAAVVASSPAELSSRLETLKSWVVEGVAERIDEAGGIFLGTGGNGPRVGFLFPGQGSPSNLGGGAWGRRFPYLKKLFRGALGPAACADATATEVAQPAVAAAALAALRVLTRLNITASVGVGHSLGELAALHWAGAFDGEALLRLARARGRAMAKCGSRGGAMASIRAGRRAVEEMLNGDPVVIAGFNSPLQTVVSGETAAVMAFVRRAEGVGFSCTRLPVSNAFHSSLVAASAPALADRLKREEFRPLLRPVSSTTTGALLAPGADLRELLCAQITSPVRFVEAMQAAATMGLDLWLEVGPGRVLRGLATELSAAPVVALDAGGDSLRGLLLAAGACFALGAPLDHAELFAGRFVRPFDLERRPRFFVNPCESAPSLEEKVRAASQPEGACEGAGDGGATAAATDAVPSLPPTVEVIRQLVAARAEIPASAIHDDHRMLDDLHLNSITVEQIVAEAARGLRVPHPAARTEYANASIVELALALDAVARDAGGAGAVEDEAPPAGVDTWVRSFTVELTETPLARRPKTAAAGTWHIISSPDHPLKEPLRAALSGTGAGRNVAVLLPPRPDESHFGLLLEGAREALATEGPRRFVLVQHGGGAAAFARTLHLEAKELSTCVVDVPAGDPRAAEWMVAEATGAEGYVEAHYDSGGRRCVPVLRPLRQTQAASMPALTADDVVVVTGGARGITAECVIALARETGARLALFGTSPPAADDEIRSNLERMKAAGIQFRYWRVDVTDANAVRSAVRQVGAELGTVTAVIHAAAVNVPRLIEALDEESFLRTLAPKVKGASHLLAAVDPGALRLFVTFGSFIARTGLRGEAEYGLANEWLTRLTEQWRKDHPHCRCLTIEWSVWSGVGMGARLGGDGSLSRQGVNPITPEEGTRVFLQLLGQALPSTSVVVAGRYPEAPTLRAERAEIPFLRFLERPRVWYPGVELVVDSELSPETDPYLDDHVFQGQRILPAVIGMEAMAQAASALTGAEGPFVFEQVEFNRPVVVAAEGGTVLRVAALSHETGRTEVVVRTSETHFQVDHFRAFCGASESPEPGAPPPPVSACGGAPRVTIDPHRDLYGTILFHRGRFRRLRAYRQLKATACVAEVSVCEPAAWFSRYLPAGLLLGDPGARDASIHAIQACIPHETILPVGVGRVRLRPYDGSAPLLIHARERSHEGDTFVYDVEVRGGDGSVLEFWEGLSLRRVKGMGYGGPWPEGLLGPYVERRVRELVESGPLAITLQRAAGGRRRGRSDSAICSALGEDVDVLRRQDGKPEVASGLKVSASHQGELTLAVAGRAAAGCDLERVAERPLSVWHDLLGADRLDLARQISRETGACLNAAATRVWNAAECLKKAGRAADAPLTLAGATADGWVLLSSGEFTLASYIAPLRGDAAGLALAVLLRKGHAGIRT